MGLLTWLGIGRQANQAKDSPPQKHPETAVEHLQHAPRQPPNQAEHLYIEQLAEDLALEFQHVDAHQSTRILFDIDVGVGNVLLGDQIALRDALARLLKYALAQTQSGFVALSVRTSYPDQAHAKTHFKIETSDLAVGDIRSPDWSVKTFSTAESDADLFAVRGALAALGSDLEVYGPDDKNKGGLLQFGYTCKQQEVVPVSPEIQALSVPARVLIIEPDDFSRKIYKRMTAKLGCQVETAINLTEASQHVQNLGACGREHLFVIFHHDLLLTEPASDWQALSTSVATGTAPHREVTFVQYVNGPQPEGDAIQGKQATLHWPLHTLILPMTSGQLSRSLGSIVKAKPILHVHSSIQAPPLGNLRLLVVEDDPINQFLALTLLENEGASVQVAGDGQQCLDALNMPSSGFDLVLMDLEMPVLGGLETCRRIRMNPDLKRLPIVAVTGHDLEATRTDCILAGFDDCLNKPLDVDILRNTVLGAVRKSRAPAAQTLGSLVSSHDARDTAILDINLALGRMGGDEEIFRSVLSQFPDHALDLHRQASVYLTDNDLKSCARALHSLKSVAGSMGAIALMQACIQAEKIVSASEMTPSDRQSILEDVGRVLQITLDEVANWESMGTKRGHTIKI